MSSKLQNAARHEAAHAIMALDHHCRVQRISVHSDGTGDCTFDSLTYGRLSAASKVAILDAGYAAESQLSTDPADPTGAGGDWVMARNIIAASGEWSLCDERQRQRNATAWVNRTAAAINYLASQLLAAPGMTLTADNLAAECWRVGSPLHIYRANYKDPTIQRQEQAAVDAAVLRYQQRPRLGHAW